MTSFADLLARADLLALRPGDTLIIRLPDDSSVTPQMAHEMRERARAHLPGNNVVVIAGGDLTAEAAADL